MKTSWLKMAWNPNSLAICTGMFLGCAIYFARTFWWPPKPKVSPKKSPPFKNPTWAVKRAADFEPPDITQEAQQSLDSRKPRDKWTTVIFFPDCLPIQPDGPIHQMLQFFHEARTSIHLCMYVCSYVVLSDAIREIHKNKGILVHVITELDTWTAHNNHGLRCLERAGIEIRLNTNGYMMHNKFAIIDDEAILTGSLNWTKQGTCSNNENVLVSTDQRIVSKFREEFSRLWFSCKPSTQLI